MGKGKKKFNSKEGEHFYLLHRSQTDSAHQQEERPSNFVLVKAEDAPQNKSRTLLSNRFSAPPVLEKKEALRLDGGGVMDTASYFSDKASSQHMKQAGADHITSLGFRNDGYDYSQHLKVMGGGLFVGADGKRRQLQSQVEVDLPTDALPSGQEFARQLEAVTLDHSCMDEDLQAALFDDVEFGQGEDCAFEELCDDFVATAMSEPEAPDFDYDKHIAELIARSQKSMQQGPQGPRGWDKEMAGACRGGGVRTMLDDDDSDVESFDGEQDEELLRRAEDRSSGGAGAGRRGQEQQESVCRRLVEDQFERVVEEYEDDEQLGDLEEAALQGGDEMCGTIELEDLDCDILNDALDDFLQESKDDILCNGLGTSSYKKGSRNIEQIEAWEPSAEPPRPEEVALQIESLNLALEPPEEDLPEDEFILQDYLRATRVEEQWDCETILSTYSTLDNHPAVISADSAGLGGASTRSRKKKVYRGKNKRAEGDDGASEVGGGSCFGGASSTASSYQASVYQSQYSSISQSAVPGARYFSKGQMKSVDADRGNNAKKIVLVGKHLLPLGFGVASNSNNKAATEEGAKAESSSSSKVPVVDVNSRHKKLVVPIAEGENEEDEVEGNDEAEEGGESEGSEAQERERVRVVKRKETVEEKRLRKSLVKGERRAKRSAKKENKVAFRSEETRQGAVTGQRQDTDRISVFKY